MPHKDQEKYKAYKVRQNKNVAEWRRRVKQKAILAMGGSCQCCGYNKHHSALEFHHIDPSQKDIGISTNGCTRSYERMKIELRKCILVCANCHREIHAGITEIPKSYAILDEEIFTVEKRERKPKPPRKDTRKIKLTNEELLVKLHNLFGNKSALARELGVTETSIRKRLKRDSSSG